jgi:hypothetical protein
MVFEQGGRIEPDRGRFSAGEGPIGLETGQILAGRPVQIENCQLTEAKVGPSTDFSAETVI